MDLNKVQTNKVVEIFANNQLDTLLETGVVLIPEGLMNKKQVIRALKKLEDFGLRVVTIDNNKAMHQNEIEKIFKHYHMEEILKANPKLYECDAAHVDAIFERFNSNLAIHILKRNKEVFFRKTVKGKDILENIDEIFYYMNGLKGISFEDPMDYLKKDYPRKKDDDASFGFRTVLFNATGVFINATVEDIDKNINILIDTTKVYLLKDCASLIFATDLKEVMDLLPEEMQNQAPILLGETYKVIKEKYDFVKSTLYGKKMLETKPSILREPLETIKGFLTITEDYSLNPAVSIPMMNGNVDDIRKTIDLCIEKNSFEAFCARSSITTRNLEKTRVRMAYLEQNGEQVSYRGIFHKAITASPSKWNESYPNHLILTLDYSDEKYDALKSKYVDEEKYAWLKKSSCKEMMNQYNDSEYANEVNQYVDFIMKKLDASFTTYQEGDNKIGHQYLIEDTIISRPKVKKYLLSYLLEHYDFPIEDKVELESLVSTILMMDGYYSEEELTNIKRATRAMYQVRGKKAKQYK